MVMAAAVLLLCAGARAAEAQSAVVEAKTPRHAVWIAIPSIDGHAGVEVGVERGVSPRVGVVVAANVRQTAAADFDAVRVGVAAEYRRFWRGRGRWNAVAGLERTGWFWGARADLGTSRLSMGERHVGSVLVASARAELGYRLTPWRGLVVTAIAGVGGAVERDAAGRLPAEGKPVLGLGLDVGWMF